MIDNIIHFPTEKKLRITEKSGAVNESHLKKSGGASHWFKTLLLHLVTVFRYAAATALYIGIVTPLGILAALKFLVKIIGYPCMIALSIFSVMGSNIESWILWTGWIALCSLEAIEPLFTWWVESRIAFKIFKIG